MKKWLLLLCSITVFAQIYPVPQQDFTMYQIWQRQKVKNAHCICKKHVRWIQAQFQMFGIHAAIKNDIKYELEMKAAWDGKRVNRRSLAQLIRHKAQKFNS
ncbi:MAG: hypothetical protein CL947_02825 [Epsilonproteobacteria bacterium]|nr:hypothetical protein [Campylobacterota bacterium]